MYKMVTLQTIYLEVSYGLTCFQHTRTEKNLSLYSLALGQNYIIMGQVGEDGRGKVMPNSFLTTFKTKNQKLLGALENKQC